MGPPSYMRSVVDRNVVMTRMTEYYVSETRPSVRPTKCPLFICYPHQTHCTVLTRSSSMTLCWEMSLKKVQGKWHSGVLLYCGLTCRNRLKNASHSFLLCHPLVTMCTTAKPLPNRVGVGTCGVGGSQQTLDASRHINTVIFVTKT
jgi:hypothetical protein